MPGGRAKPYGNVNSSILGCLICVFSPAGWFTEWYWPPGVRGKLYNLFHGHGWRTG